MIGSYTDFDKVTFYNSLGNQIRSALMTSPILFSKEEKALLIPKIKMYLKEELGQDIGNFDAEFLLDFFSEEIGVFFYNRGIRDSLDMLDSRIEEVKESLYMLEKPTSL
jgi:uncharacterized protein (DUF2164 family)